MSRDLHEPIGVPNYRQAMIALAGLLVGLTIFIGAERLVVPHYRLNTWLDADIPFLPWSWGIYVLFFPFIVALSAYAPVNRFRNFTLAAAIAFAVALVCFFLFPEVFVRPDTISIDNDFLRHRFSRMWMLDLPANGFPSLHVTVTCLACGMVEKKRNFWAIAITGIMICLSTLTVKQHTLADVAGGVVLAGVSSRLAETWRKEGVSLGQM